MAVRRHGKKWRADWRDEFGIRRRKDFDRKADADVFEGEQRKRAREGRTGGPPTCHPDITLAEYTQKWLGRREAQGIDPGTVHRQEIDLRRHILPRFGATKVREMYRPAVRTFLLSKLGEGSAQGLRPGGTTHHKNRLARGSVRSIYHTLSAVLSEAVEDRLIPANPLRGLWKTLNRSAKVEQKGQVKALDPQQATAFLAAARKHEPRHHAYFATLMLAGLRPAEGLAVTVEKVDLKSRALIVDGQIGQHGGHKRTKTGGQRTVDLSAHLVAILRETILAARKTSVRVVTISGEPHGPSEPAPVPGPWLFYSELGPAPDPTVVFRVYKNALRAMRRCLQTAGLPHHFGLHSLRHTFGSGLVSAGVSPAYVQRMMGHRSVSQTIDTYGQWLPIKVDGAMDALAESFALGRGHQMDTHDPEEASETG